MKKFAVILMTLSLALSLTACGGDKEKTPETTKADSTTQSKVTTTESTTAPTEVSLVAKGEDCTITVPKLETFFNGYEGATVKYNNPSPNRTVYVNLYKDDPKLEVNVSVTQLAISSAATQDAKGYADYYNSISKKLHYDPVEVAGFSGYLATDFLSSTKTTDNVYMFDYPLPDGSSVVINLWVTQRFDENTSEMKSIAEAFLKNIKVTPNND